MTRMIRDLLSDFLEKLKVLKVNIKTSPAVKGAFMKSKRMIYWAFAIPVIVVFLIMMIVKLDTADNFISRSMASKAMALALTDRESISASQSNLGSLFDQGDRDNWYTKYIDYLMANDYLEPPKKADQDYAADALTYGEAAYAAEKVSPGLSQVLGVSVKKYKKPIPKEEWWLFYESFLKRADVSKNVGKKNLVLYGTPDNVKEAAAWTAYTDTGIMGFEGNALDAYIDHEIQVYYRGSEIIHMTQDVSDEVVYKNVLLSEGKHKKLNMYVGTIVREFPMNKELEDTEGVVADVSLVQGKIKKLSLKKDTIQGKVLAVREDSIEIEGYGSFKLDSNFRVYKTYGIVKEMKKKDILVGYDIQQFVVTGKKLCAALLFKNFAAQNIRVLVMDTDFESVFHQEIRLKSDTALTLKYQDSEETIPEGTELIISKDDERIKTGRLSIEPADQKKTILVQNIKRGQGTPAYFGRFEVSLESDGLLLINELDIEDYLTKVVPSEMPPSYELEALKVQAVCARTYAYRQIQANAYSQYGAHVDDSTNYQVYNNIESSDKTDMAVKETYGEMVFIEDEPAETFYFSTSCGHTTDGTIWGASLSDYPYLKGVLLSEGAENRDFTSDEVFVPFIKANEERTYDSTFPLYRWTTTFTSKDLEQAVEDVGKIKNVTVTERGTGGIAKSVNITGSDGTRKLSGQTQIRNILGNKSLEYIRNDGKTMSGWASLPSAFITIEETARNEDTGVRTFTIYGGGYGHGVGMSQNGAQEMARQGKSYRDILNFFYTGVEVREGK